MVVKPVFLRQGDPVFVNIFLRPVCFFPVAKISGQGVKCYRNVRRTSLQNITFNINAPERRDSLDIYYPKFPEVNIISVCV